MPFFAGGRAGGEVALLDSIQPVPHACIQLGIKVLLACALWINSLTLRFPLVTAESQAADMVA